MLRLLDACAVFDAHLAERGQKALEQWAAGRMQWSERGDVRDLGSLMGPLSAHTPVSQAAQLDTNGARRECVFVSWKTHAALTTGACAPTLCRRAAPEPWPAASHHLRLAGDRRLGGRHGAGARRLVLRRALVVSPALQLDEQVANRGRLARGDVNYTWAEYQTFASFACMCEYGYDHREGNRRVGRNGRVSDLPQEIPNSSIRNSVGR